jgi:DNA-directed RNA polymerase subunit F
MEIINERFVSWAEAKKILDKKAKEKELGYEQKNALEHLKKFCKLSEKKTQEIADKLRKIEKLKDRHIINIIAFLPKNMDELRVLFAHEIIELSEDEKKKILNIVKNI